MVWKVNRPLCYKMSAAAAVGGIGVIVSVGGSPLYANEKRPLTRTAGIVAKLIYFGA